MMLFWVLSASAECPPLASTLEAARDQLLYVQMEAAQKSLELAHSALSCTSVFPPELARYWLLSGLYQQLSGGDPENYAASRRIEPRPDLQLGPDVISAFKSAETMGTAEISVDPPIPARVDGRLEEKWPLTVATGPHLVQVWSAEDRVLWSRELMLEADQKAMLQTGLPEGLGVRKKPFPVYLASGLLAVAGGTLAAWGAGQQDAIIETEYARCSEAPEACDKQAFMAAGARGDVLTASAYALWGLGATGVLLQFVLPFEANGWKKVEAPAEQ